MSETVSDFVWRRAIVRRRERAVRGTMRKAGAAVALATFAVLATRRLFHVR